MPFWYIKKPTIERSIKSTTRKARNQYSSIIDFDYQKNIEIQVSLYIQDNFTFTVFEVISKAERLEIESRLIATVSWCDECKPSNLWLGNSSPKDKIVKSGLWLVNELYKTPFDAANVEHLSRLIARSGPVPATPRLTP